MDRQPTYDEEQEVIGPDEPLNSDEDVEFRTQEFDGEAEDLDGVQDGNFEPLQDADGETMEVTTTQAQAVDDTPAGNDDNALLFVGGIFLALAVLAVVALLITKNRNGRKNKGDQDSNE